MFAHLIVAWGCKIIKKYTKVIEFHLEQVCLPYNPKFGMHCLYIYESTASGGAERWLGGQCYITGGVRMVLRAHRRGGGWTDCDWASVIHQRLQMRWLDGAAGA